MEVRRRLDAVLATAGPWRLSTLPRGRSDHTPLLAQRVGRGSMSWCPAADLGPWIARQQAWRPQIWRSRRDVQTALGRELQGARTCADIQAGLVVAAKTVRPEKRPTDVIHDELSALLGRLRAHCVLLKRLGQPSEPAECELLGLWAAACACPWIICVVSAW